MNIQSLKCPECGGNIDLKEGQKIQYCPYCGAKLYIDDGTRTIRKEYQDKTRLEEMKFQRQVEKEKKAEQKAEETHSYIALLICLIVIAICFIILAFI